MALDFLDPTIVPVASTFLFVFAVVFGLLTIAKSKPSKEERAQGKAEEPLFRKNVNAIIALVFAAFSAVYEPLVTGLQQFIPIASGILVVLFFLVFLKRIFGSKEEKKNFDALPVVLAIGLLLIILGAFWDDIDLSVPGISAANVLWLIGVIIVIGIFYAVYKHSPPA